MDEVVELGGSGNVETCGWVAGDVRVGSCGWVLDDSAGGEGLLHDPVSVLF